MTSDIINLMSFKSFNWPINHNLTTQINNSFIRYCIIINLQTIHHITSLDKYISIKTDISPRSSLTTNEVQIPNISSNIIQLNNNFVFKTFHNINLVINIFTRFLYHHFSAVQIFVYILYAYNKFPCQYNTKPKQIFKHISHDNL